MKKLLALWLLGSALPAATLVAEHVAVAEFMLLEFIQKKLLLTPVDAALAEKARGSDEKVIARQLDRSQKVKTAEFLEPRHAAQIAEVKAYPGYPKGNPSTGRP